MLRRAACACLLLAIATPARAEPPRGFTFTTADGAYALTLGGYLQGRYGAVVRGGELTAASGFALRRARLSLDGTLAAPLGFRLLAELATTPLLVDAYADWTVADGLVVRAGRDKAPFSRAFQTPEEQTTFAELPVVVDALRWARDLGVQLRYGDRRRAVRIGVGNGAVDGALDQVPAVAARAEWRVTGERIDGGGAAGRIPCEATTALTFGASAVIDAVVPGAIGTIAVDADIDDDGQPGRVIVLAASADAVVRRGGWEVIAEGLVRRDDWGKMLLVNPELVAAVGSAAVRTSTGGYVQATRILYGPDLLVGARVGWGELPFLSMRSVSFVPRGQNAVEASAVVLLYRLGARALGATYTFIDYGDVYGPDGAAPSDGGHEQRIVVEAQLTL